ncbi:MAG: NifU family protein [Ruminobacter sp.]|uniref:Fe/S biogenesis protein NfuA n=1 Tax=Ruminobacter amylophilus TaxID=867 RepID=A0A662ZGN8_9GAMM|nr:MULTISPECIES: NifU family protein [Ruminobacter]MBQ3775932.1 NifU family protein [Ruminobacter sp.]SFP12744.1 Fe/S biogenesis protein NfuA [Ruminobacter amylophilus]
MIKITPKAEEYFVQLLKTQAPETKIRVFVSNPGTPGVECGILYCPKNSVTGSDDIFNYNGFDVVIDVSSQPYLEGAVIDFKTNSENKSTLTFKAPNLKKSMLDENASLYDRLELFFRTTVNPSLAAHGGVAKLISVSEDGVVKVSFEGGCKGCSMVNITLSEGIEANLKQAFPGMIKEVIDVTDHEVTDETYAK